MGSVLFTIQYFSMEPKALCFRVVRLSVCACVCNCLCARAETFFDRLAVDLVVLLSCTFMHFNEKIYMILEIVSMVVVITIMCCPDNERRSLMVDFDNIDEGRWAGRERWRKKGDNSVPLERTC